MGHKSLFVEQPVIIDASDLKWKYYCFQTQAAAQFALDNVKKKLDSLHPELMQYGRVIHTPQHKDTPYRFRLTLTQHVNYGKPINDEFSVFEFLINNAQIHIHALDTIEFRVSSPEDALACECELRKISPFSSTQCNNNSLFIGVREFEKLRTALVKRADVSIPQNKRIFNKCLRSDDMNYFHPFLEELVFGTKFPKRQGRKKAFTVTGLGVFSRSPHPKIPLKTPQYTAAQKQGFTNFQSTSLILPQQLEPNPFGFNRDDLLINFQFAEKDVLTSNRNFKYDGGTRTRPYDSDTHKNAEAYYKTKDGILFSDNAISDLETILLKKENAGQYSELLVRLRWNCDGSSRITISTDSLEARILAREYANKLLKDLQKAGKCPPGYQVPIYFYIPGKTELHHKTYTEEQYLFDCLKAKIIHSSPHMKHDQYNKQRFEFLLALPVKHIEEELINSLALRLLKEGYLHIFRFLKDKVAMSFEELLGADLKKLTENKLLTFFEYSLRARYFELADYLFTYIKSFPTIPKNTLDFAIKHELYDWVTKISDLRGLDQSIRNSALLKAATVGNNQLIATLLESKADINTNDPSTGYTPLILAASSGHTETVEYLMRNKAYWYYCLALKYASKNNHTETVICLLKAYPLKDHYFDHNYLVYYGGLKQKLFWSQLQNDLKDSNFEQAEFFFKHIKKFPSKNIPEATDTLVYAIENRLYKWVDILFQCCNHKKDWNKILLSAYKSKDTSYMAILLKNKVNINTNLEGSWKALTRACVDGDVNMVSFLLANNAEYTIFDRLLLGFYDIKPEIYTLLNHRKHADEIIGQVTSAPSKSIASKIAYHFKAYANPPLFTWRHHKDLALKISTKLGNNPNWSYEECMDYIRQIVPQNSYNKEGTLAGLIWEIESKYIINATSYASKN